MRRAELSDRERRLIGACEVANEDAQVKEIERDFDALTDEIPEPWEDALP